MENDLDECLQFLHKPKVDTTAPLKCYHHLRFSTKKSPKKLKPSANYFLVMKELLGDKIELLDIKVDAYLDGKLFVPFELEELVHNSKKRMVMIPVESETGNFYGLVYDKNRKTLELFRLPGSRLDPELYMAEKKMVGLFEEKYKLPVIQFYQAIRNEPKEGTRDHETWPAWLVFKRLHKPNMDREIVTNYAMEEIVKNSKEYLDFLKAFY